MTPCRAANRISSAGSISFQFEHLSARSAQQAKANPSLRTGAGGVGGLVAVSIDGDFYFPGYDNNGNVIGYWNENGEIVAEYAYDAFGNTIYEDGDLADFFPHRFSTKYYDAETDLYYYGYRYYSPALGRWISRDPIGENGGANLFGFCHNASSVYIDPVGSIVICFSASKDNDDAGDADRFQTQIATQKSHIREFANQIESLVSRDKFDKLKANGFITFNGMPFPGTKKQYLVKIRRELQSRYQPSSHDDIRSLVEDVSNSALFLWEPYDMIGVTIHGEANEEKTAPTGRVILEGPNSVDYMQRGDFNKLIREKLTKVKFPGELVIASCYQTFEPGNSLNENIERMKQSKERLKIHSPLFFPRIDDIKKYGANAFLCGIGFEPFTVTSELGGDE